MAYDTNRSDYLLKQAKTEDVVEELITLNFGLINKQLHKFYLYNDPDALSFAYEALYKAILTFDPNKNNKFSTYATVCIYNRLGSYVRALKAQQETLSYDELENECHSDSADKNIMAECAIYNIEIAAIRARCSLSNATHRLIVDTWVNSNYTKTHSTIASELGFTQPYVTQVISKYKKILKRKLEEIDNE